MFVRMHLHIFSNKHFERNIYVALYRMVSAIHVQMHIHYLIYYLDVLYEDVQYYGGRPLESVVSREAVIQLYAPNGRHAKPAKKTFALA